MKTKVADVYKLVLNKLGYNDSDDTESILRTLRNKFSFIMSEVIMKTSTEYKVGRDIEIPSNDAPIIRNLLYEAVRSDAEKSDIIVDWFNNRVDYNNELECICLFNCLKVAVMGAEMTGETDSVTVDEWLGTIKGVLGYTVADKAMRLKSEIEKLRLSSMAKDDSVGYGDIIFNHEDGNRNYIVKSEKKVISLDDNLLGQIVKDASSQRDYFDILTQIVKYMVSDVEKKAIPDIEQYLRLKGICENAYEAVSDPGNEDTMVSDYFPRIKRMHDFLRRDREEAKQLSERVGCSEEEVIAFFER